MQTQLTPQTDALLAGGFINAWHTQVKGITAFFEKYTDADYLKPIAPNRNRPIYILGHLIAANDVLMPLLGFGQKLFPELEEQFITNADNPHAAMPSLLELRQKWETQQGILNKHFNSLEPQQWLERHTAVSEAAFAAEPHRNRLTALLARTAHMSYHLGQLNLFPEKKRLKYNPFHSGISLNFAF
ncbi:hypothetical protein AM493_15330 [Flavobacterium akiainvivens]|uniref:Uncharacterized protein n=1 Tax=Flavobacterium akiainvivens TaxID=1202724 RepID=A0A0M8MEK9_9FLAO|nr:DinB family protein [Flavobacterium akiainvivens]KOS07254.1 hypothetical protein AM493_15330 [Flavobacterium akiainvivens]SFQ45733.1 DinB superfamily protein [Flavobacterium akiainvivens]